MCPLIHRWNLATFPITSTYLSITLTATPSNPDYITHVISSNVLTTQPDSAWSGSPFSIPITMHTIVSVDIKTPYGNSIGLITPIRFYPTLAGSSFVRMDTTNPALYVFRNSSSIQFG